jgi:hypothetical protein
MHAKMLNRNPARAVCGPLQGLDDPRPKLHESDGTIRRRMLLPLLPERRRIGRQAFQRVIDALIRSANACFVEKDGKRILMAKTLAEDARALGRFKRAERQRTGARRLRRSQDIPIAVLVDRVTLRKRLDLRRSVRADLPRLAAAIRRALARV